jgi:hypothetical protein
MAKKAKAPNPFTGRWRIVSMDAWDQDFVDEEEEGYFEFTDKGRGEFHFGYVHGQMDCHLTTRDSVPAVEWTWDGNDEMDPAQGRGWAVIRGDELHGGTDLKLGASFDRESSATGSGRTVSGELSAYQHAAQHAVKCAEEPPTRIVSWQS